MDVGNQLLQISHHTDQFLSMWNIMQNRKIFLEVSRAMHGQLEMLIIDVFNLSH